MANYGRWSLLSAFIFFGVGVTMLVRGIGPEVYSYVSVILVFVASAAWTARYVFDVRKAGRTTADDDAAAAAAAAAADDLSS